MVCWHGLLTWSVDMVCCLDWWWQCWGARGPWGRGSVHETERIWGRRKDLWVSCEDCETKGNCFIQISLTTIWFAACGNRNRSLQTSKAPLENQAQGTNLFASYCCLLPDSSKGRWWWLTGLIITTRLTLSVLLTLLFSLLLLTPVLGVCGLTS